MRLIDADKYLKDLLSAYDDCSIELDVLDNQPLVSAIPIPEGATNGDMFMIMFPDLEIEDNGGSIRVHYPNIGWIPFDIRWWNALYKEGMGK